MAKYRFSAVVGEDADGFWAYCPELTGCCVQGETHDEALANLREACLLHVGDRLECGEDVPVCTTEAAITVELAEAPDAGGGRARPGPDAPAAGKEP